MRVALLLALAACQQSHAITIQLGPTDDTLTAGFACFEEADPTKLMAARAKQPDNTLQFSIIVDVITLGGVLPGCRGEELFAACGTGDCKIVLRDDGTRYCRNITVDAAAVEAALAENLQPMLASIRTQLQLEPVTLDAPDEPVILRAVATTESCSSLAAEFDPTRLVGCAYSCPAQLDDVDSTIALSLDTLNRQCEDEVRACAVFPP